MIQSGRREDFLILVEQCGVCREAESRSWGGTLYFWGSSFTSPLLITWFLLPLLSGGGERRATYIKMDTLTEYLFLKERERANWKTIRLHFKWWWRRQLFQANRRPKLWQPVGDVFTRLSSSGKLILLFLFQQLSQGSCPSLTRSCRPGLNDWSRKGLDSWWAKQGPTYLANFQGRNVGWRVLSICVTKLKRYEARRYPGIGIGISMEKGPLSG